jgi:N-acetyl-gamma-glutamyl-phosphate reductase
MRSVNLYAFLVNKLPVGVLGASGYAGRELCALIEAHPGLELAFASAHERRGEHARLGARTITYLAPDDAPLHRAALVFAALPHGVSSTWADRARGAGAKVVDLSNDLRPGSTDRGVPYGLPELTREHLRGAELVANPGCYPTLVLLALAPLLREGLIAPGATVNVSAASGVTGAGFTPRHDLLFGEVTEDFRAYAAGNTHRHLAEMRAMVARFGADVDLLFTPHLLPVARGILATISVPLAGAIADPLAPYRAMYADEPFVEVSDEPPALRDVVRRNVARISATLAAGIRTPTLVIVCALDNLMKGAAGQAVQNANLQLGLDEPLGLPR